jgi:hypothetical protein
MVRAAPNRAESGVSGTRCTVTQPLRNEFQKSKMNHTPMSLGPDYSTREP